MTAEPIVPQSVHNSTTEHQSMMDRAESVLTGAWNFMKNLLPADHPQTEDALNNIKASYDNAVKVIQDDLAKSLTGATQAAETELPAVVDAVETGVKEVATDVTEALPTPTETGTLPTIPSQAPSSDAPAETAAQA